MSDYVATPESVGDEMEVWLVVKASGTVEANPFISCAYGPNHEETARSMLANNHHGTDAIYGAVVKVKVPRSILRLVRAAGDSK